MRPLRPQSWWTICCREPFHRAATRSRDSLPMYHLSPTRVPSVRKQHCFISFAILFHMFPLVIYCLLHQWNHRLTGYEFCNRVEPKLEPIPITTSTREGPNKFKHQFVKKCVKSCWSWPKVASRTNGPALVSNTDVLPQSLQCYIQYFAIRIMDHVITVPDCSTVTFRPTRSQSNDITWDHWLNAKETSMDNITV